MSEQTKVTTRNFDSVQQDFTFSLFVTCLIFFIIFLYYPQLTVWNKSNIYFSEKIEEVCDVCQRKYTTTLLQGRKKYTIISINRTKFLDPNLKSKCKIKIPIHAILCILHWREIQTHLILIFPTSLLKTLG